MCLCFSFLFTVTGILQEFFLITRNMFFTGGYREQRLSPAENLIEKILPQFQRDCAFISLEINLRNLT